MIHVIPAAETRRTALAVWPFYEPQFSYAPIAPPPEKKSEKNEMEGMEALSQ